MIIKPIAHCPVGDEILGYLVKGEVCSFICRDCRFIFTWGRNGVLKPPIKLEEKKINKCGCVTCKSRNEI